MLKILSVIVALISVVLSLYHLFFATSIKTPVIAETAWKENYDLNDTEIHPFTITVPINKLNYLKERIRSTTYSPPLTAVNFEYGFNTDQLKKIAGYWLTNYKWEDRIKLLNAIPHYRTKISGLYIHFIHLKPDLNLIRNRKVIPLLLLHGWPGSVKEFYQVFPLLTTPVPQYNFVFEIIAPSLPGYGFSDAAEKPGLHAAHVALIMKNLMNRIGFKKFYVQGGDWGAFIGTHMATLYPESVIGFHSNMCTLPQTVSANIKLFLGSLWPDLITRKELKHRVYPLSNMFSYLLEESGYMHLQATKPDTVGVALSDSPVGLAAYILEKFSTWENYNWRNKKDGGLTLDSSIQKNYSMDDLLDNVMIYYITNTITSSMRLYSETLSHSHRSLNLDSVPTNVPTVCAVYPFDIIYTPEIILREKYHNLLYVSYMPIGGHFAAFEQPKLFAADLWKAVCNTENKINNMYFSC